MMQIQIRPEPADFDAMVRQPGSRFLRQVRRPTNRQFRQHRYWKRAIRDLGRSYCHRCAYTSIRLIGPGALDEASIDHFLPKGLFPELAFEWDNFRFARKCVNNAKSDHVGIVDPFCVRSGWFVLDIPSCLIKVGQIETEVLARCVSKTISVLGLNDIDHLVAERCDILMDIANGVLPLEYIDQYYPFIAHELRRQNMLSRLSQILG